MNREMIFLITLLFSLMVGCKESKSYKNHTFRTDPMSSTSAEARVPSGLWDILEGLYTPLQAFGNAAVNEKREKLKSRVDIPMKFMPFKVYLVEKTRGVLGGEHHELVFGDGGGTLDFRDFLTEKEGNLIFGVELNGEILKNQAPHVYFLSNAKRRKIDGTTFGGGCETYMEITEYFSNVMKHDGIAITTLDSRHVLLLAGTFFFGAYVDDKLLLAQLTVKDSRYKSYHCRGV